MSSVDVTPAVRTKAGGSPPSRRAVISGFGGTRRVTATLVRPRDAAEVAELLASAEHARGLIARGSGLSYGDPAQNDAGTVLETSALGGVHALDARSGDVTVGAGMRLDTLLRELARYGLTLPVVPGTSRVTVGGAIAADVHGKNHPRDGSFASRLRAFTLCTPAGGAIEVNRTEQPELFAATAGGMGLTGVVTAATLETVVLRTPAAVADVDRVDSLEQALELLERSSHSHAIAWLDLLARGRRFTRAIVTRSREGQDASGPSELRLGEPRYGLAPPLLRGVLRPATVRAFNELLWLRTPRRSRERPMAIGPALFPLDAVAGWNRAYGHRGLIQYQLAVPNAQVSTLRGVLEMFRAARLPMYLATLKRLGAASGGMLSFPLEGWTLAVDLPAGAPGAAAVLERADATVAAAGGRVYLAKDARMSAEMLAGMYPELPRFLAVRARVDPNELLRSDMSRRLRITP